VEDGSVFVRVLVIVLFVEFGIWIFGNDVMFGLDHSCINQVGIGFSYQRMKNSLNTKDRYEVQG
jgi:hypothetical protein